MGKTFESVPLSAWLTRPGADLKKVISGDGLTETSSDTSSARRTFTYAATSTAPWWRDYLGLPAKLFSPSSRSGAFVAIRVTRVNGKEAKRQYLVFAFGTVTHLIAASGIIGDFGLQLATHLIEPDAVLAADTMDVVESRRQRTQLAQGRQLGFVDPDAHERVLRRITATADSAFPGSPRVITGSGSVRFTAMVPAAQLDSLAKKLVTVYQQRTSPVIPPGSVAPVTERSVIEAADSKLLSAVTNGNNVVFAFPEIVDPASPELVSFRGNTPRPPLDGIDLSAFSRVLQGRMNSGNAPTVATLKNASVNVQDPEGSNRRISLYRCLTTTVSLTEGTFVLVEGAWYRVDDAYLSRVTSEIAHLAESASPFPARSAADFEEVDYNLRVATDLNGICLDRGSVSPPGQTGIEPSDIIRLDGDDLVLTHVKPGNSSSTLSHLVYQGQVSTTALFSDAAARTKLIDLVRERAGRADLGLPKVPKGRTYVRDNTLSSSERDRRRDAGDELGAVIEQKITDRKVRVEYVILHGRSADSTKPADLSRLPTFTRISFARAARVFRQLDVPMSIRIVDDVR